jgi:hypothetical protein
MNKLNIQPVTPQDLEDAANLLIMTVNAYIGFDKSGLEVAGAAHTVLNVAMQNINKQHEQTTGIGETESSQRAEIGPGEVQETGKSGGAKESPEGILTDVTREEKSRAEEKPRNEDQPGASVPQKSR